MLCCLWLAQLPKMFLFNYLRVIVTFPNSSLYKPDPPKRSHLLKAQHLQNQSKFILIPEIRHRLGRAVLLSGAGKLEPLIMILSREEIHSLTLHFFPLLQLLWHERNVDFKVVRTFLQTPVYSKFEIDRKPNLGARPINGAPIIADLNCLVLAITERKQMPR